jgi:nucleoside phosphorylase
MNEWTDFFKLLEAAGRRDHASKVPRSNADQAINKQLPSEETKKTAPPATQFEGNIHGQVLKSPPPPVKADVVLITALADPELVAAKKAFGFRFSTEVAGGVVFQTTEILYNQKSVKIAFTSQTSPGMVSAAILTTKSLYLCAPQYVIMTGICAGVRGSVQLGQIVVANTVFDHGSGKLEDGELLPDYPHIPLDHELSGMLNNFCTEKHVVNKIVNRWPDEATRPNIYTAQMGQMASGAAVVADDQVVAKVVGHQRKLIAIDMEAYGVAKAVHEATTKTTRAFVIKAVSDFGDKNKDNLYQPFCAYASAEFAKSFLERFSDVLFSVYS